MLIFFKKKVSVQSRQSTAPNETAQTDIKKEVKKIIKKNFRLIRETVDLDK